MTIGDYRVNISLWMFSTYIKVSELLVKIEIELTIMII
jgi:hypothetical protein